MNIHEVLGAGRMHWLWIDAHGGNGRIQGGCHLWQIDEGAPPPVAEMPEGFRANDRNWWEPQRFQWTPFKDTINLLFEKGWVKPLCGKKSRAMRIRAYFAWNGNMVCPDCRRLQRERGIIAEYYETVQRDHTLYQRLVRARTQWRNTGRRKLLTWAEMP